MVENTFNYEAKAKDNTIEKETYPVIVAGLNYGARADFEHSLEELISLVEACDLDPVCTISQNMVHPDPGTYFGAGKISEIKDAVEEYHAEYVVVEDNLSPAQLRNIEGMLKCEVWDRTTLILEIFSRRAKTREARLQVEAAYLKYMLPRLSGMWQHLGRQGGGGGSRANKGEGETQIELDRRQIRHRIDELGRELKLMEKTRNTQRMGRDRSNVPKCALVGYTNAGKSTIMNMLLTKSGSSEDKKVLQKDMLFATLDTSIRLIKTEDNRDFLLSDTVGFIEHLPHELIKAFRSTLEEAVQSDLLLVVLDASDEHVDAHKAVTESTLREIGGNDIPRIYIMNKSDCKEDMNFTAPIIREDTIFISAKNDMGLDELIGMIGDRLYGSDKELDIVIPYSEGEILNILHEKGRIYSEEYKEDGVHVKGACPKVHLGALIRCGLVEEEKDFS